MRYLVKAIYEPDYGCEERPETYVPMDTVVLENEEGEETRIKVADNELYEKNINEGDRIRLDDDNRVYKEEQI